MSRITKIWHSERIFRSETSFWKFFYFLINAHLSWKSNFTWNRWIFHFLPRNSKVRFPQTGDPYFTHDDPLIDENISENTRIYFWHNFGYFKLGLFRLLTKTSWQPIKIVFKRRLFHRILWWIITTSSHHMDHIHKFSRYRSNPTQSFFFLIMRSKLFEQTWNF